MADPRGAFDEAFDTGLRPGDIDPLRPRPIDTPWGSFAIFSCDARLRAVQSFCPHLGGPLFHGSVAGGAVTCPWHQWRFSLANGRRLDEAGCEIEDGLKLDTLEVRVAPEGTLLLVHARRSGNGGP